MNLVMLTCFVTEPESACGDQNAAVSGLTQIYSEIKLLLRKFKWTMQG